MNFRARHYNLFFDAANLVRRAFHVAPSTDVKSSDIFDTLEKAISYFRPKNIFVVWNGGVSSAKRRLQPTYKTSERHREREEEAEFQNYLVLCQKAFSHMPVRQLCIEGLEAKDVIGFLWDKLHQTKVIVSNDQDLYPLVGKDTILYRPLKDEIICHEFAHELLGFPLDHYTLWRSMVGSSEDHVPGISGIGENKAKRIINAVTASGKKLPIRLDELQILERNKLLFSPGALLTHEDKVNIINTCVKESAKDCDVKVLATILCKTLLATAYPHIHDWVSRHDKVSVGRMA